MLVYSNALLQVCQSLSYKSMNTLGIYAMVEEMKLMILWRKIRYPTKKETLLLVSYLLFFTQVSKRKTCLVLVHAPNANVMGGNNHNGTR